MKFLRNIFYSLLPLMLVGIVISPLLLILFWNSISQSVGFCSVEGRFFSPDAKIQKAIEKVNWKPSVYLEDLKIDRERIPYESVDQFLQMNPDCCSIYAANKWESFIDSWGGSSSSAVTLTYVVHYRPKSEAETGASEMGAFVNVDACGGVSNSFF